MGTSVNQRSPDTTNWRIVQRAYQDPTVPVDRALREIWRAATNQEQGDLAAQLAQPVIGSFAALASAAGTPAEASREAGRLIAEAKCASLGADIARRAAIQSAGREDAQSFFTQRLFAEATNYLVSRDLPGHVAEGTRIGSVSEAREFRQSLTELAANLASGATRPAEFGGQAWASYVGVVLSEITGRRPRE